MGGGQGCCLEWRPPGWLDVVATMSMDMSEGHGGDMPPDMPGAVMLLDARTGATIRSVLTPAMNPQRDLLAQHAGGVDLADDDAGLGADP